MKANNWSVVGTKYFIISVVSILKFWFNNFGVNINCLIWVRFEKVNNVEQYFIGWIFNRVIKIMASWLDSNYLLRQWMTQIQSCYITEVLAHSDYKIYLILFRNFPVRDILLALYVTTEIIYCWQFFLNSISIK
jgi:hypothetical protein